MKQIIVLYACVNIAATVLVFALAAASPFLNFNGEMVITLIALYSTWLIVLMKRIEISKSTTSRARVLGGLTLLIVPPILLVSSALYFLSGFCFFGGPDARIGMQGILIGWAILPLSMGCYALGWFIYFKFCKSIRAGTL
jgi:hypothetical protein